MRVIRLTLPLFAALVALAVLLSPLGSGTAGAAAPTTAAAAATAPTWSLPSPTTVSAPYAKTATLNEIACADAVHCLVGAVGQDASGLVYGTADSGASWSTVRAADTIGGGVFACAPQLPSAPDAAPFCLSVGPDEVQNLSVPGAPVTGPSTPDFAIGSAAALACPSSSLCVAAGGFAANGEISVSTDPLTGAWSDVDADPGHPLIALSCQSTSLCVAVDSAGGVVVSTDPAAGTWTRTALGSGVDAVSCASDQVVCVAVASTGAIYSSTNPASGIWQASTPSGASAWTTVSCASAAYCLSGASDGTVFVSTTPAQPATFAQLGSNGNFSGGLSQVICFSAGSCAAVSGSTVSTYGFASHGGWQVDHVFTDGWTPLSAISCPSTGLCVALQSDGRAAASVSPTSSSPWTVATADRYGTPVALSCPSTSACYSVDDTGRLVWSTAPATGTWRTVHIDTKATPVALSCPSTSLCVMVDSGGRVFSSSDPGGGVGAWHEIALVTPSTVHHTKVTLTGVSCPVTTFCAVTAGGGSVYTTSTPRGARSAWKQTVIWKPRSAGDYSLAAVSCPSRLNCTVAATDAGPWTEAGYDPDAYGTYALTSYHPAGGASQWKRRQIDNGYVDTEGATTIPGLATGLSCPTTRLCAMVDNLGTAVTNTGISSGPWLSASIQALATPDLNDGDPGLTGVSCFRTGGACVAVDGFGNRVRFGPGAGPITPVANPNFSAG